jgi:membrane fusion protein (multidrug efflux system)
MKTPVIVGLTIFALLMGGCGNDTSKAGNGTAQMKKKPGVKVMVVKPQPIASKIKVTGTVDSRTRTWVTAPTEGIVLSLDVREGKAVSPGSVIGSVMSTDQQNMLALAEAEYNQARRAAENDSASAVKEAKARLDAAKSLYKSVPVVCPIRGIVITKAVEPGAIVAARQQLVEVADLSQLIVKSAIAERYNGRIKTGQKVRVTVSGSDSAAMGTVNLMYPSVDVRSRTMGVEIALGSRKNLRPGMSAIVEFVIESRLSALCVPYDAVLVRPNGDKIVFTVIDSTAHGNKVATGIETNSSIEIAAGLNAGDKVIVMGQDNLKDGAIVKVMETPAQAGKGGMKK